MKLFHATSVLLAFGVASAKPGSPSSEENGPRSAAGLRELRKLAHKNERGLFGDLLSGFGGLGCGGACGDPEKCASFMGAPGPSVLEESCDAGCVPEVALSTCDRLCGDDDAATVSVQRLGLFDAATDLLCGNCKFYECCAGGGASYEACEGLLPDEEDLPDVDTLLPDFGFGDVLDLDSFLPDFGDASEDTPGLDFDAFLPDGFPDIGSIIPDWDDVSSSSGSASGLSILGQLGEMVGGFDCPESCGDSELCESVLVGMSSMGDETLKDACNAGCIPMVSSAFCEDTCGNVDGPEFMGSVADLACDACKFVECCAGDESDDEKFDACKELLPTMDDLLPDIDWDDFQIQTVQWNLTDWGAGLDWSGIASDLSEVVEAIHSLFDEALGDFQAVDGLHSFPMTCNPETCPIDGLCDMATIHVSSINFEDACETNAFFECAEGLEEMCANECDAAASDNFLSASFCSMCNMAECCRDNGSAETFEYCAWGAVPEEISDAIGGVADVVENIADSIADTFGQSSDFAPEDLNESEDKPIEASPPESGENPDASAEDYESESLDDPIVAKSTNSLPEDLAAEVSSKGPVDASAEASASELDKSPGGPTEDSASESLDVSAAEQMLEASQSGSRASGASTILAVASIAALAFVSF